MSSITETVEKSNQSKNIITYSIKQADADFLRKCIFYEYSQTQF